MGGAAQQSVMAVVPSLKKHERHLSFYNANTGERLQVVYWERQGYVRGALAEINYLLRDHHTDRVRPIDVRLLDLLHDLSAVLETVVPLQVLSAYRSRATNLRLRARGYRAARHSWHVQGQAIDIRIPGRSLAAVRRAALALKGGGVG